MKNGYCVQVNSKLASYLTVLEVSKLERVIVLDIKTLKWCQSKKGSLTAILSTERMWCSGENTYGRKHCWTKDFTGSVTSWRLPASISFSEEAITSFANFEKKYVSTTFFFYYLIKLVYS